MTEAFAPVKGKCLYWREALNDEERWSSRLKPDEKHVDCTCFVEGDVWRFVVPEVPADCPNKRACRYYIKHE